MKTRIVHARISENNTINGKAGDQTKQEVRIQDWYSRPWNVVIRSKNIKKRAEFADFLIELSKNENIGYSQAERNTLLKELERVNFDPKKVGPCNCDCSSFVTAGLIAVGYPKEKLYKGNSLTTRDMKKTLLDLPDFFALGQLKYTTSSDYLIKGDILLSEGHHVAVNITDGLASCITEQYFPRYEGESDSIVDALKSLGVDSSSEYRKKIAAANNIVNPGSAEGNMIMLVLLKNGALKQP